MLYKIYKRFTFSCIIIYLLYAIFLLSSSSCQDWCGMELVLTAPIVVGLLFFLGIWTFLRNVEKNRFLLLLPTILLVINFLIYPPNLSYYSLLNMLNACAIIVANLSLGIFSRGKTRLISTMVLLWAEFLFIVFPILSLNKYENNIEEISKTIFIIATFGFFYFFSKTYFVEEES